MYLHAQPYVIGHLEGCLACLGWLQALELCVQAQVLEHCKLGPKHIVLWTDAKALVDLPTRSGDRVPEDDAVARGSRVKAAEHGERRRLARAVVAEHARDLFRRHGEAEVIDGELAVRPAAVPFRQVHDLDARQFAHLVCHRLEGDALAGIAAVGARALCGDSNGNHLGVARAGAPPPWE